MTHPRRRLFGGLAIAALAVVALAGPASAHVEVSPSSAPRGSDATLSFTVPTESDTASTVQLAVQFPIDEPLADVSVKPHPGWSFTVTKAKLTTPIQSDSGAVSEAVSEIVWKADSPAAAIKPGEFDEFVVAVGPLPNARSMTFKALQTYSDGSVVRWIEESTPGGAEPEHPAPVLTLTSADASSGAVTTAPTKASNGRADTALVLAVIALLLGTGGLGLGLTRRR
jgi:uncharacterized protein